MENASKALIIAGAILISIVLISLGVVIISQGQDTVNSSNMEDQTISTWNQKWTQYAGDSVSGSTVNTLINQALSNNATATKNGETEKVIRLYAGTINSNGKTQADTTANKLVFVDSYNRLDSDGKENATGTKQCTVLAKPNVKYKVMTKNNTKGYANLICIQKAN